jgi:hypothetical protein
VKTDLQHLVAALTLTVALPFLAHAQEVERFSVGIDAAVWDASNIEDFSVVIRSDTEIAQVHSIADSVPYGVRPFLRLGLSRELAVELSHEFSFGDDVDIMVSSASAIWRPFGQRGLELHASLCYGQLHWDGPGDFNSPWGWEAGAGYSFWLSESPALIVGVAYRDLSFGLELEELQEQLPQGMSASASETSLDSAGVVGSLGFFFIF